MPRQHMHRASQAGRLGGRDVAFIVAHHPASAEVEVQDIPGLPQHSRAGLAPMGMGRAPAGAVLRMERTGDGQIHPHPFGRQPHGNFVLDRQEFVPAKHPPRYPRLIGHHSHRQPRLGRPAQQCGRARGNFNVLAPVQVIDLPDQDPVPVKQQARHGLAPPPGSRRYPNSILRQPAGRHRHGQIPMV